MNRILHLTSFIARKKDDIETLHGIQSFWAVISLVAAELLLLFISLPIYIALRPGSEGDPGIKQYQRRRVVTLSLIFSLGIIWLIKLVIILMLSASSGNGQIRQEIPLAHPDTQTSIVEMLIADKDSSLAAPIITSIDTTFRAIEIDGTAPKNTTVIVAFTDTTDPAVPPKFYSVKADAAGRFAAKEDRSIFYLSEGSYSLTAISLDEISKKKSAESKSFSLTIDRPFIEDLGLSFDRILNILAILFIAVGFVTMLLTA